MLATFEGRNTAWRPSYSRDVDSATISIEREAIDGKHVYLVGLVYAMTRVSFNRNLFVADVATKLGNQLESRPCTALGQDMWVRIEAADTATHPDLVVLCGEPQFYDERCDAG